MKYILTLIVMLSACAGSYSHFSVATETYPSAIDLVANAANNDMEIVKLNKHTMITKWEKVFRTNRWEYHYRFVVNFDKETITAQCMIRDQSLGLDGKPRAWKLSPCRDKHIMQLVHYDLDTLRYGQN